LLGAYGARRTNGALSLLVLNKDRATNFTAQIAVNNFVPWPEATVRSYGIPQDEAVRTNGPTALKDVQLGSYSSAGTNFSYSFPPLSLTVLTLAPDAARLQAVSVSDNEFVFQLSGQPGTPYVIQSSTNLQNWSSVSTNRLVGSTLNLTNPLSGSDPRKFWRAVWRP
jgi:hypothetical protein